jgi:4-amino-4-deoxy-L-arabinose transferase-like glycosyltransferase
VLRHLAWLVPAAAYLAWLIAGLRAVPFHPDEATWIYMSRDFDRMMTAGSASLCWQPESAADPLQIERERACALPRFVIGLFRSAGGRAATTSDWDWSASWEENVANGALPSEDTLFLARLPQAAMLFVTLLVLARIGWRVAGLSGGMAAAMLFGLNSQVLLHARRAMSESTLLLGMVLSFWAVLELRGQANRRRDAILAVLAGFGLATAVSAKLSGGLILPPLAAGLIYAGSGARNARGVRAALTRLGIAAAAFLVLFLIWNPFYLCHPMESLQAVISARESLFGEQVRALSAVAPGQILNTPGLRLLALAYQPFFAPPAFWDIPNYAAETAAMQAAYTSDPLTMLTAGGAVNAFWLGLCVAGFGLGVRGMADPAGRRHWSLLWLWLLSVAGGILLGVPILWQRFYLILVPVLAVFSGAAVSACLAGICTARRKKAA